MKMLTLLCQASEAISMRVCKSHILFDMCSEACERESPTRSKIASKQSNDGLRDAQGVSACVYTRRLYMYINM